MKTRDQLKMEVRCRTGQELRQWIADNKEDLLFYIKKPDTRRMVEDIWYDVTRQFIIDNIDFSGCESYRTQPAFCKRFIAIIFFLIGIAFGSLLCNAYFLL